MLFVNLTACPAGSTLPLATARPQGVSCHTLSGKGRACAPADLPKLPVGTSLADEAGTAHLVVTGQGPTRFSAPCSRPSLTFRQEKSLFFRKNEAQALPG